MLKLNPQPARFADSSPSPESDDGRRSGPPGIRAGRSASPRAVTPRWIVALLAVCMCGHAAAESPRRPAEGSFAAQIARSQLDAAIALGNMHALGRIDKASRLDSLYNAMIETERARIALRRSVAQPPSPQPPSPQPPSLAQKQPIASPVTIDPQASEDTAADREIQIAAYQDDGDTESGGGGQVVTLLRPTRHRLESSGEPSREAVSPEAIEDATTDQTRPRAMKLRADNVSPATTIQPAMATPIFPVTVGQPLIPAMPGGGGEAKFSDMLRQPPLVASPVTATTSTIKPANKPSLPAPAAVEAAAAEPAVKPAAPTAAEPHQHVADKPSTTAVPPAASGVPAASAGAPDASVAMQWPFALGGRETLPTPPSASDVTLSVDDVDVRTVLEMLAKGYGMNILVAPDVEGTVTANVTGLTPEQTLSSVARMTGLAIEREDNVILIYPKDNLPRESRQLRVFPLDFARSEDVEPTITGLLSPIGSAYSSKADELDHRRGRESIVVVDTPSVLAQVEQYLMQADQAPLQVMIEARVLEIELKDNMEHGVNFEAIFGGDFRVGGFRLTDNIATSTNPFYFAEISGTDLKALLTLLETTTDAKTLATPRVMVVNGQNAKIQVGQQLGFAVATVTQTSTIQDVRYLDTGVVLNVTPTISRDNRVLLQVKPKVSSGEINPDTLLPEETTREVETSVMLDNHQGMIVGGLIQEEDRVVIKKLPWLGDVKHVGKLFQRRETSRARTEIIVALIPHIVDPNIDGQCSIDDPMRNQIEWQRTENSLFNGPLNRECRPWEARLPDVTAEGPIHRDIDRQRNRHPYCKGCEPIKTSLLPIH
ncbi:Type IV pilus biogenesis and competence protein PilQ precursor [Stieleria maiorica]|uniref:Type IV pilus biogenesis and competence protein PilQ n=1 Tax=Stieleria maiorica TaxID=2795974 RepID=A0A5B9MKZ2_9BACT|nr:secretin and TonB N-terminal domain-containing protein [Stieleria maiorica]QEG00691.1 Type IV pilus biogenesis and competence protein PilQ precursor [Stieleria maiorica]